MVTPLSTPLSSQETQPCQDVSSVRAQKLSIVVGCELTGVHVAPRVTRVQTLAGQSPPQPVTQHLWEKAHSVSLEHFPKLNLLQISSPDGVWVACSQWWKLPVVAPRCIDAPVDVQICGLVWDCSLV